MVSPWVALPGGSGSGSSVGHLWESLLTSSADEISTGYGHIAETIELPADKLWVAFELRPEAKFSDGTPITAEDVAWTYRTLLEQGRPGFRIQMADVKDVVVESPRRVVFHFKSNENRELPLILGGLPVLPKHFFDGRDFTKPLTDPPIGSGPYRIADFELGRSVTYVRRPDWWARGSCRPARGPTTSIACASSISATRRWRWRRSRPARSTCAARTSRRTGRPPMISRRWHAGW